MRREEDWGKKWKIRSKEENTRYMKKQMTSSLLGAAKVEGAKFETPLFVPTLLLSRTSVLLTCSLSC